MSTEIVTVESIDFPVATYCNIRVVTTDLMAQAFGATPVKIRQNHANNRDRFEDGKHFFKIAGEELLDFVSRFNLLANPSKVRSLILWTERGAARHAKMLETDQAWEVFEKLEDAYFLPVERPTQYALKDLRSKKALPGGLTLDQLDAVKALVKARVDELPHDYQGGAAITCWSALKTKFGCTYKAIPPEHFSEALSLVARLDLRGSKPEPAALPKPQPRYHFPLSELQPKKRIGNVAWLTYEEHRRLLDHGAPLGKLLHQHQQDGDDVSGPQAEYRGLLHLLETLYWQIDTLRTVFTNLDRHGLRVTLN